MFIGSPIVLPTVLPIELPTVLPIELPIVLPIGPCYSLVEAAYCIAYCIALPTNLTEAQKAADNQLFKLVGSTRPLTATGRQWAIWVIC